MKTIPNTPITAATTHDEMERIRRDLAEAARELQVSPLAGATTIKDVALVDTVATPIPHRLGVAAFAIWSAPRGPATVGMIEEVRESQYDRALFVVLKATGYGATITVDVKAVPL